MASTTSTAPSHAAALIEDIKNGETITLDGIEADSVRDFGNWSAAEDLPEIEKNYLDGVIYNHMPNRSDNCLFFGKLAGNDDTPTSFAKA